MAVIGALLLVIGTIGTIGSILFGGLLVGQWALAAAVSFVMVGVTGVLLVGGRR